MVQMIPGRGGSGRSCKHLEATTNSHVLQAGFARWVCHPSRDWFPTGLPLRRGFSTTEHAPTTANPDQRSRLPAQSSPCGDPDGPVSVDQIVVLGLKNDRSLV